MSPRSQNIISGILIGALGAWMSLAGLGIIKTGIREMQGPGQVVAGLMFFFAGAWSFFRGTLGPAGQNLPVYPWIQYFMVLPILAGFGFIILWSGIESGDFFIALLGILPLLGALWFAIANFPGRRKKP